MFLKKILKLTKKLYILFKYYIENTFIVRKIKISTFYFFYHGLSNLYPIKFKSNIPLLSYKTRS